MPNKKSEMEEINIIATALIILIILSKYTYINIYIKISRKNRFLEPEEWMEYSNFLKRQSEFLI
jgi:hypothetical protein